MTLTVNQLRWALGGDQHFPCITEDRYHRLMARKFRKLPHLTNRERRRKLFDRQCGICPYCGRRMSTDKRDRVRDHYMTEEHVTPASREPFPGTTRVVVGACFRCNQDRGNTPLLLWVWKIHRPVPA